MEDLFLKIMGITMLYFIMPMITIIALVGIPYMIYESIHEEMKPSFELKKDQWRCTAAHEEVVCAKGCWHDKICDQYQRVD